MNKPMIGILIGLLSASSWAAENENVNPSPNPSPSASPAAMSVKVNGSAGTRFDSREGGDSQKVQAGIILGLTIDTRDHFQLVAIATTGTKYGKSWYTAHDLKTGEPENTPFALYFRQLYLSKAFGKWNASAGALPAMDQYGTQTGFGKNSWVDGARVAVKSSKGMIGLTTGSLSDMNNPDVLNRKRQLNYVEVYVEHEFAQKIFAEMSMGEIDSDKFIRVATKKDIQAFAEHLITLVTEGLANLHEEKTQISAAASASTDLLSLFSEKYRGIVDVIVRFSYGDPNMGTRGLVADDLYMSGPNLRLGLDAAINKKKTLRVNASVDFRRRDRVQVGVKYRF